MSYLINPYVFAGAGGIPYYQELARTTLSGTAASIDVSYSDKPYVMILISWARETGATGDPKGQLGVSSVDSGSNYARRLSESGGSDSTNTSVDYFTQWATGGGSTVRNFQVIYLLNNTTSEKLIQESGAFAGTAGAGTAAYRTENVAKWVETGSQAGYFSYVGNGSTFSDGSEVVVLGADPSDTSGANFWEELSSVELGSAGDIIDSGTITSKKYLWYSLETTAVNNSLAKIRFNSDNGNNYSNRRSTNGGSDFTSLSTSNSYITIGGTSTGWNEYATGYIINNSTAEKLVISDAQSNNGSGAGVVPARRETVNKWQDATTAITSVQMVNGGTGDFDTGSTLTIWGHD